MRIIAHREQQRAGQGNWELIALALAVIAGAFILHFHQDDDKALVFLLLAAPLELSADKLFKRCAGVPVDEAAWEEFTRRYQQDISAAIYRVLGYPPHGRYRHLFADAMQHFNLRLLEKKRRVLLSFRGHTDKEARAFLRRVAASAAIYVRDKMAPSGASLQDSLSPSQDDFASRSETLQDSYVPDENYLLLRQAIERCLPQIVRGKKKSRNIAIFKLAIFGGLSPAEIAGMPGFNAGSSHAIEQMISRIRSKVRQYLDK